MTESPLRVCVLVHLVRSALVSLKESTVSHNYLLAGLRKPKQDVCQTSHHNVTMFIGPLKCHAGHWTGYKLCLVFIVGDLTQILDSTIMTLDSLKKKSKYMYVIL